MLITVMYPNNEIGMVEAYQLDELIAQNKIKKFLRSEGWCIVGVDPIREESRVNYKGQERRQRAKKAVKV